MSLERILKAIFEWRPSERVDRLDPAPGCVGVSTVLTSAYGYETAVLDHYGAHPVERYENLEEARAGHRRWVRRDPTLKSVLVLGDEDLGVEDEVIVLIPPGEEI